MKVKRIEAGNGPFQKWPTFSKTFEWRHLTKKTQKEEDIYEKVVSLPFKKRKQLTGQILKSLSDLKNIILITSILSTKILRIISFLVQFKIFLSDQSFTELCLVRTALSRFVRWLCYVAR